MAYISSNNNRYYVALEAAFGQVSALAGKNRIPAVKLATKQKTEKAVRRDKTGTRTFLGDPSGLRRATSFDLATYMTAWTDQTSEPVHGPLFQAGLGAPVMLWAGGTVASSPSPTTVAFAAPHGLTPGQAVSINGDLRFVAAVVDSKTVQVNAPFSTSPQAGAVASATAAYQPATELPSVSVFDYWDPSTAAQRFLCGAAVNEVRVKVNGDFHSFEFAGQAADLVDTTSFQNGDGNLTAFPQEPAVALLNYSVIPGHLGQAWLGSLPTQFFAVTNAQLTLDNGLALRATEFGASLPRAIVPGIRTVSFDLSLYQQDDTATQALYQAARQRSPIGVMLQLGENAGQLFGIYLKSVVPEVPEFNDGDKQLQWHFTQSRAQGDLNDEIFVAFG